METSNNMNEKLSRLRNNKVYLAEKISGKLTELFPLLLKHGLITEPKLERVKGLRYPNEKSLELLSNLNINDDDSYKRFVDCLRCLHIDSATSVLQRAGVTVIVKVRFKKNSQSIEYKLVQHLNNIKTFNGPQKDSVAKYIDRLKESDIGILEAVQQKDSYLAIWLWCCSPYGVQRLKFMLTDRSSSKSDLTYLFSKLFNHLLYVKRWYGLLAEDTVDIKMIDFDEGQLEKTFDEPLERMDRTDIFDLINCTICLEPYNDPRALPCLHTFCMKCLETLGRESEPGEELRCPMCRASFVQPKGGFTQLPTNFYAKKIQQRLASDSHLDTLSTSFTKSCTVGMPASASPADKLSEPIQESSDENKVQQKISTVLPNDSQSDTYSIACTRTCEVEMSASLSPTVNAPDPVRESSGEKQVQQRLSNDSQSDTTSKNSCMVETSVSTSPTVILPDRTRGSLDKLSSSHQEIPVMSTISAGILTTNELEKTNTNPVIESLEMNEFYVKKMKLIDILTIENQDDMKHKCLRIAKNLMKLNCKASLTVLSTKNSSEQNSEHDMDQSQKSGKRTRKSKKESNIVHPMDVMNVIYNCCDNNLLQALMTKLFMCQLAIPLIFPDKSTNSSTFLMWALREIVAEIKIDGKVLPIVETNLPVISFMRIGNLKFSKSKLLNNLLRSTDHNTFFHRDCENGTSRRMISNGTVEATWFQPSQTKKTGLQQMLCLLNLRGDSKDFPDLSNTLCQASSLNFVMLDVRNLSDKFYESFFKACTNLETKFVVCFMAATAEEGSNHNEDCDTCEEWLKNHSKKCDFIANWDEDGLMNSHDWKREIENTISENLEESSQKTTLEKLSRHVSSDVRIDENDADCANARKIAQVIARQLETIKVEDRKVQGFPLHGKLWKKWTDLEKQRNREHVASNLIEEFISKKEAMQKQIRLDQFELFLKDSPFTKNVLNSLVSCSNDTKKLFLIHNLKFTFDNWSREIMPRFSTQYHEKNKEYRKLVSENKDESSIEIVSKELNDIVERMADASLGVEHLCREMGQIYEAYVATPQTQPSTVHSMILASPLLVANLIMQGMPLEIMDGDTSFVPKTWIKAVFDEIEGIIGKEKKVFVISVVGIQSSGKSTFLNTMFGLQFAASAGRCTRGVYCQLIPVDKQSMNVEYDYILVVDTEGLRAPELQNASKIHDNELATFVIGLGNITIVNIKGENSAELQDILQIVIHALLRMKVISEVKMSPSCVFVHQNVAAVNAEEKLKFGQENLLKQLDEVTLSAAQDEKVDDRIRQFKHIIEYEEYKHAVYLPDLWEGVPPMAPVSSEYSERVTIIRDMLIRDISSKSESITIGTFSEKVSDLWDSILCENFVFSFRNSEEVKLYSQLDTMFSKMLFDLKIEIMSLQGMFASKIQSARDCDLDDEYYQQLKIEISKHLSDRCDERKKSLIEFFNQHAKRDVLEQWKGRYIINLEDFRTDEEASLERDVESYIHIRKEQLKNQVKVEDLRHEMIQKTTTTARDLKLKSEPLSDENLLIAFENLWILWASAINTKSKDHILSDKILNAIDNELCVLFNLHLNILKDERNKSPLNELNDFTFATSFAVIKEDLDRTRLGVFENIKDKVKHVSQTHFSAGCTKDALSECNSMVRRISSYVTELSGRDFKLGHITEIAKMIKDFFGRIEKRKNQSGYNFQIKFQIRFAIHVFKCAANEFLKFGKEFQVKTDPFISLRDFKESLFLLFKNTYNDISREEYAANVFATSFTSWMKDKIEGHSCALIVKEIANNEKGLKIFESKQSFIAKILRNLGEEKVFSNFMEYLDNPELFLNKQIHNYEQLLTKKGSANSGICHSLRDMIVKREVNCYKEILLESIASVKTKQIKTLSEYLETLKVKINARMFCPSYGTIFLESMEVKDFQKLSKYFSEAIRKSESNIIESIKASLEASSNEKRAVDLIADRILGCPEKCPFCSSPCCLTDKNHEGDHRALHHYPFGIKGMNEAGSDKLCMYNCQSVVDSDMWFCPDFVNPDSKEYFKNYRNYYPRWEILPDRSMKSSLYWKWFIVKFQEELLEHFKKDLGDIPKEWYKITWAQAKKSLK